MINLRRLLPAFWLGAAAGCVLAAMWAVGARLVRCYRSLHVVAVEGASMSPALRPGDFILLRRGIPPASRAAGRIVAARAPGGRLVLKRIVGLPGESLHIGKSVAIDGHTLDEPYAHGAAVPTVTRSWPTLNAGQFFLVGDHRAASTDSRHFGPLHADAIEGTAWLRYWPPTRAGRLPVSARRFRPQPVSTS